MADSLICKRSWIRGLAAVFAVPLSVSAGIGFDKLTACDDIARLYSSMLADRNVGLNDCRPPSSSLEKALVTRLHLPKDQLCIQGQEPAPFVGGFSCMRSAIKGSSQLICYRGASIDDVRAYKSEFEKKYAQPSRNYLVAAAKCSASNGDTAPAPSTTAPMLLAPIARFEFGFIAPLGKVRPASSSIVHGYASTDGSIGGDAPSAIEFVYLLVNAPKYVPKGEAKAIGDWTVYVDDSKETNDDVNRENRKRHIPLKIVMTTFSVERDSDAAATRTAKLALLQRIQRAIGGSLDDEGFESVSDSDLEEAMGKTSQDLVKEVTKSMPFGNRNVPVKLMPQILMYYNQQRPSCTRQASGGAIVAYLTAIEPVPEVESDYGNVGFAVAAFGSCSRESNEATKTYINGLIEEATNQVMDTLRRAKP